MRCLLTLIALFIATLSAQAQERRALLIGNQTYAREVGALANPINDVNLIAASLRQIGFANRNITIVKNGNRRTILRAIDRHANALKAAGSNAIGFLYYSGHGAANNQNRRNYLIPVGVKKLDADVWYDSIPLDGIVSTLKERSSNAAHFVIFDACRNLLNMPTKGGKGFVPVATRRGMLIAFSTDPGQTASDDGQVSGPYAAALATELVKPGVDHLDLFQNVKEAVYAKTRVQVPWTRDGMLQRVYLGGRVAANNRPAASSAAAHDWQFVKDTKDPAALRAFAKRYKNTVFADMALAMAESATEIKPNTRVEPKAKPGKRERLASNSHVPPRTQAPTEPTAAANHHLADLGLTFVGRDSARFSKGPFPDLPKDHPLNEYFRNLPDEYRSRAADLRKGTTIVASVEAGSDAAEKGILKGDRILEVNSTKVSDTDAIRRAVSAAKQQGRTAVLLLLQRKDQHRFVAIRLPKHARPIATPSATGMIKRVGLQLSASSEGLKVVSVASDSDAAEKDIRVGDVVLAINARPAKSVDIARDAINTANKRGRRAVLMTVKRGSNRRFIAVQLSK